MAKRSVRAYVELASGLGEMTRARAVEAAHEIVVLAGSAGSKSKVAKQAEKLAGDLLSAAEQNRAQVVGLVQREVESAVERVDLGRVLGEVQGLAATVAGLAARVDELARSAGMRSGLPGAGLVETAEPALAPPPVTSSRPARPAPPRTRRTSEPASSAPTTKATAKKSTAKKSTATKTSAPTKKTTAKKTTAKKSTATKTSAPAKKTTAKKSTATKSSAPAKKSTAKKSTATKSTATKSSAPAKKSTAKKSTAKKSTAKKTTGGAA
ncbi:hypothetical protein KMZ32_14995 [Phycicoccus sp. MAQZ13P-2]|uniref:hypothetical protein n=1 Tax=Phycicoccus mangrovi TaxID=2840470 RepID=UPI001C008802|nr:hypothetical protein [Phycicoccus mangrovi]MBT9257128.1 hypothetical protein [Phycicoccus mangrovi]MBT9275382.1 hypothetical protein [Phycicoccus mangrovi]